MRHEAPSLENTGALPLELTERHSMQSDAEAVKVCRVISLLVMVRIGYFRRHTIPLFMYIHIIEKQVLDVAERSYI